MRVWDWATVDKSSWQPWLPGLLWSLSSCCKALRCVWGHYPAAVWIRGCSTEQPVESIQWRRPTQSWQNTMFHLSLRLIRTSSIRGWCYHERLTSSHWCQPFTTGNWNVSIDLCSLQSQQISLKMFLPAQPSFHDKLTSITSIICGIYVFVLDGSLV